MNKRYIVQAIVGIYEKRCCFLLSVVTVVAFWFFLGLIFVVQATAELVGGPLENPVRISQIIEEAQRSAGVHDNSLTEIAILQASLGDVSGAHTTFQKFVNALNVAAASETKPLDRQYDLLRKVEVLSQIAVALHKSGHAVQAKTLLRQALRLADGDNNPFTAHRSIMAIVASNIQLCEEQAVDRDFNRAVALVQKNEAKLESEQVTIELLVWRAERELDVGDEASAQVSIHRALDGVKKSSWPGLQWSHLPKIAVFQARLGDDDGAQQSLGEAFRLREQYAPTQSNRDRYSMHKVVDLSNVSIAQVQAGHLQVAVRTFEQAKSTMPTVSESWRAPAWRGIARAAAALGKIELALEAEALIEDPSFKEAARHSVIEALIKEQKVKWASELAGEEDASLAAMVRAQLGMGDVKGAKETFQKIRLKPDSSLVRLIAKAKTELDGPDATLEWARKYQDDALKVMALLGVCDTLLTREKEIRR